MANLKDIRSRIATTKNTQQITKAMKMVSAAKLRRAQINIQNMRPYALKLKQMTQKIVAHEKVSHPLLNVETGADRKVLVVTLSSDRGLCGAFNSSVIRASHKALKQFQDSGAAQVDFLFIGRKGADALKKTKEIKTVDVIYNLAKDISYGLAAGIAARLRSAYVDGQYSEVHIVYNEFKSAIQQDTVVEQLLPLQKAELKDSEEVSVFSEDIVFEPAPQLIMDQLLEKFFTVQIYRIMSESVASEHGARMTSMENATKNAGQMISDLTLTYNKMRQAAITTELIEITSGAEALKG